MCGCTKESEGEGEGEGEKATDYVSLRYGFTYRKPLMGAFTVNLRQFHPVG